MLARFSGRQWRSRFVIALVGLTLLILAGVSAYSYTIYQQATADLVTESDRQYAFVSAVRLQGELGRFSDELFLLARSPTMRRDSEAVQRAALHEARHRLSIFDGGAVLLDNFGQVRATEPERSDIQGADWSDREFFREMLISPRSYYSNVTNLGVNGSDVVLVSVPVLGENQEFIGALVGMFRVGEAGVSPLYASIVRLRIGKTGTTYLVDSNGRILYDSDQARMGGVLTLPPAQSQTGQGEAQRMIDLDGNDVITAFAPVPGTRWTLVIEDEWAVVTNQTLEYARNLLGILAVGIILPVLGVALLIRTQNAELLGRERVEQEQRVAGLIQQRVLPRALPMLPGWNLTAFHKPVNTPGQDFYDTMLLEDGQLILVIGHVVEEGLAAAHILSTTRAALRGAARQNLTPAEALHAANTLLCPELQMDRCVTLVYAVLDAWGGRLRFANAGFNAPWLDDGKGDTGMSLVGLPLGASPDTQYEEGQLFIQPGHCVIFYSNGVVRARDNQGRGFGLARLRLLADEHDCDVEAILEATAQEIKRFQEKGSSLPDDFTVLMVQRLPVSPVRPQIIERTRPALFHAPEFDVD